ncbi:hypothetical protein RF55_11313 [Lasius niger]|uniref:Uncharacterized protein n=1 Tax=Lasius niger TaxID=67767 RepID=A0A0J7KFQ0_LASNI|nr:hypothetical protein RF55_11313 [Lasius niger]
MPPTTWVPCQAAAPGGPTDGWGWAAAPRPSLACRGDQHAPGWGIKASAGASPLPAGRFGKGNGPDRPVVPLSSPGLVSEYVRAAPVTCRNKGPPESTDSLGPNFRP